MNILKELEYPIPEISVSTKKIVLQTHKSVQDKFVISNAGGNILKGEIISDIEHITFSPLKFEGNKVVVKYKVSVEALKPHEIYKSNFVIVSNGGEVRIDVLIKVTMPILVTKLDVKISSLEDFYKFTIDSPVEARFVFTSQDFLEWLKEINFKNLDSYLFFLEDHNKERGLDNFLLANGLKEPAKLLLERKKLSIRIEPFSREITTHTVRVLKEGTGYFKTTLNVKRMSPWLHVETKSISSTDFINRDFKDIDFYVNAKYVDQKIVSDSIVIDDYGENFIVEVIKNDMLNIYLSKKNYDWNEMGKLIIENNCEKDIVVELFENDDFIRFEGQKYFVGKNAVIPFMIKMSAFKTASTFFKKQPIVQSSILVKAYLDTGIVTKRLPFSIGTLI